MRYLHAVLLYCVVIYSVVYFFEEYCIFLLRLYFLTTVVFSYCVVLLCLVEQYFKIIVAVLYLVIERKVYHARSRGAP